MGPVVGIGASAGGLEALLELLPRLRPNGRTRYLIAQHLLKDKHNDLMVRILARRSGLPVVEASDGDFVSPDRLYLIPSGRNGVLIDGHVKLTALESGQISAPSVNVLFASIAADVGARSIGVVLSGAGTDGVIGAQAIKARGGVLLSQKSATALIDGMPGAVLRAGLTDDELDPAALADRINELGSPPRLATPTVLHSIPIDAASDFDGLIKEVSRATGIDFSSYKNETLLRRTQARMKSLGVADFKEYLRRARGTPRELEILGKLFNVSLSWFFRDHSAFTALRASLAERFARIASTGAARVWIPGCASGEECYSIAILLNELAREFGARLSIDIIGSDLNGEALEIAQRGVYPQRAFKETNSPDLIAKYFVSSGESYQVTDELRGLCRFRKEDVITAAPPNQLALVSCRNLLIYMRSDLQERLIGKFFEALSPEGLLFVGMSENIGVSGAAKFATINSALRIFCRK